MCRKCFRISLIVLGSVLLFVAAFPVGYVVSLGSWETAFMGAKLLMLPVGALCVLWAAGLSVAESRRKAN
jgi:hypothetical protein